MRERAFITDGLEAGELRWQGVTRCSKADRESPHGHPLLLDVGVCVERRDLVCEVHRGSR